jgi:hypothetical protein
VSAQSPAKKTAGQIEKETLKKANIEWRRKEFFLFYLLKEQSEATSTIRQSSIVIQWSFTRAPPLAKKAASLIEKETFGTRFGNRPLLVFAFRYNNGKM